jgi:ectoine hydroxylase-related dioxygenase (phytanoyl-CoA dioxygenase family)
MRRRTFLGLMGTAAVVRGESWSNGMSPVQEISNPSGESVASEDARNLARLTQEMDIFGFTTIPNLIPQAQAEAAGDRVVEIMKKQPNIDDLDQHLPHFLDLLAPSDYAMFAKFVSHPLCIKVAEHFLGPGLQLTEPGARWMKPGCAASPMHVGVPVNNFERWGLQPPTNTFTVAFSWMLNDLAADMAPTAYLPCSQWVRRGFPGPESGREYAVPVAAPAGSVVVYHNTIWHGFAANTSKTKARVAVMGGYCASWIDPVGAGYGLMHKRVYDKMPPAVQALNRRLASD